MQLEGVKGTYGCTVRGKFPFINRVSKYLEINDFESDHERFFPLHLCKRVLFCYFKARKVFRERNIPVIKSKR